MKPLASSCLLGLVQLWACAPSAPSGEKLGAAELSKVEGDATAIGHSDGGDFAIYTGPDGRFAIKMANVDDTGRYRITGDGHVCLKYNRAFDAREYCNTIYRDGQTYWAVGPDGSVVGTYTMTPGNPRNLRTATAP
jgi:hypothetical protein